MGNLTLKPAHFSLPVELRFVGIPTHWVPRDEDGRRYLVPLVNQRLARKNERILDPDSIRQRFFKMKNDEQSALDFLNSVGVWSAEESSDIAVWSDGSLRKGKVTVGCKESWLVGAFGHRFIQNGRAIPWDVESLCRQRDHWRRTLTKGQTRQSRKRFGPRSGETVEDAYTFALKSAANNTLPMHLEWKGKHAIAVIQPITGEELLKALSWIDAVTGAECKVCHNENCGAEYTRPGRKFCSPQCERATTVRNWRRRKREAEEVAV